MAQLGEDLVLEGLAPDGAAAAAGAGGIAGLEHEVGDYAVDRGVVVVAAAGEGGEVFAGLGGMVGVELERECALFMVGDGGARCLELAVEVNSWRRVKRTSVRVLGKRGILGSYCLPLRSLWLRLSSFFPRPFRLLR